MKGKDINPILLGGFGDMKSNGGKQYYQQDRVYSSKTNSMAVVHSLDSYMYLVFENDNFKLFKEEGMSYTVSVYNGSDSLSVVTTDNDTLCNSVFDIANFNDITSEEMTIKVIYTFNISDQTYFRDTVYPTLIDDDFNFALSAKLTGK